MFGIDAMSATGTAGIRRRNGIYFFRNPPPATELTVPVFATRPTSRTFFGTGSIGLNLFKSTLSDCRTAASAWELGRCNPTLCYGYDRNHDLFARSISKANLILYSEMTSRATPAKQPSVRGTRGGSVPANARGARPRDFVAICGLGPALVGRRVLASTFRRLRSMASESDSQGYHGTGGRERRSLRVPPALTGALRAASCDRISDTAELAVATTIHFSATCLRACARPADLATKPRRRLQIERAQPARGEFPND